MPSFNKYLRQFLVFIRKLLGVEPTRRGRSNQDTSFWLGLWNGQGRLAQSPNVPRPSTSNRPGQYTVSAPSKRHKYQPDEVKRILRGLEKGEHAQPVLMQAATFGSLIDERMVRFFRGRERMFDRLTYVVFQYTQGRPCEEIARSVSYFSDGEDVEDAIDFACRLIANQLNRQRY